ncbi:MAG: hypothetical protein LBM16_03200 [Clostridiales bacterium]|nr:hypothetical protein [Clostridiales bacterium]
MSKIYKAAQVKLANEPTVLKTPTKEYYTETIPEIKESEIIPEQVEEITEDESEVAEEIIALAKIEAKDILEDAEFKAEDTISRANARAEMLLSNARIEAESIIEEFKQDGYNQGYQEGMSEVDDLKRAAEAEIEDAKAERQKILAEIEPDTVRVICESVQKILNTELVLNPNIIVWLIRKGLSESSTSGLVKIHVSKEDYDEAVAGKDQILPKVAGGADVEFIRDFALGSGDCIIETPYGNVDCSIDTQYAELKHNLFYILGHNK